MYELIYFFKFDILVWEYEGGFWLLIKCVGKVENLIVDFLLGIFSFSIFKKLMFVVSNLRLGGIGEFFIFLIIKLEDLRDFVKGEIVL